jgi:hypothetical protein
MQPVKPQAGSRITELSVRDQGGPCHNYRDEELTFLIQVHRDYRLARTSITDVRRVFPGVRLLLVSDGDDDPRWPVLAARARADYVRGDWLYGLEHGGRIVQRMLALHLERPTPWLIRIDTDTRVHRRFRWLPLGTCVFGTLERETYTHRQRLDPPCVQGGFLGFTVSAVERLSASRLYESHSLCDPSATWADTQDVMERASGGRVSFDHLVRYGCRELGVEMREFDEVRSVWRGRVRNDGLRYAVTHPHKSWRRRLFHTLSVRLSRLRARRQRHSRDRL